MTPGPACFPACGRCARVRIDPLAGGEAFDAAVARMDPLRDLANSRTVVWFLLHPAIWLLLLVLAAGLAGG